MANHILDRVPVERISDQASRIQFSQVVLTILAALFYAVGWTAGKVFTVAQIVLWGLWTGITWSVAAVRVGWTDARTVSARGRAT